MILHGSTKTCCTLVILVATFAGQLASSSAADDDSVSTKSKREAGGPSGLFPFPRIGRSGPDTWFVDIADTGVPQAFIKRQGLVPFPRIGRSGGKQTGVGSNSNNAAGLWFGPRLGRLQKRDSYDSPWALVTLRDFPSITSRRQPEQFTPRLGRESAEDIWEDYEQHQQKPSADRT